MPRIKLATALLLFALAPIASADVIYEYTGMPFDTISGTWSDLFQAGPTPPTQITATVQVASPFPTTITNSWGCGFVGSPLPGLLQGDLTGIISATISDGARTISDNSLQEFDEITLAGCGTQITQWYIGAVFENFNGASDAREIVSDQGFDRSTFVTEIFDSSGMTLAILNYTAGSSVPGQWTATITPEVNTGLLALVSGSLLLLGYWRKPRKH